MHTPEPAIGAGGAPGGAADASAGACGSVCGDPATIPLGGPVRPADPPAAVRPAANLAAGGARGDRHATERQPATATAPQAPPAWRSAAPKSEPATTDPLTGLAGRQQFVADARSLLLGTDPGTHAVATLFDIDAMAVVNQHLGYETGDLVLVDVGRRLSAAAPARATVARIGGDEFGVLFTVGPGGGRVDGMVARLVAAVSSAAAGPAGATITTCTGVATATPDDLGDLVIRADLALAYAKQRGPRTLVLFDDDLQGRLRTERRLRAELSGAATRGELRVCYQPVMTVAGDELVGFEALVRWRHPELGMLTPDRFVPIAEASGDIVDVDAFVLRRACLQLARWARAAPGRPLGMAVNVSARQVVTPSFAAAVADVLRATDVAPARLCLEVTESAVVDDVDGAVRALRALRAIGVRVAIDDFGTGFSSLAYLRRFPADHLKIDRSFVSGLDDDPVDTALVDSVLLLARRLGVGAVAEGVETAAQHETLRRLGCPLAQGFHFARPMAADAATALLAQAAPASRRADDPWSEPPATALPGGAPRGYPPGEPTSGGSTSGGPTSAQLTSTSPAGGSDGEPDADRLVALLTHELRSPIHAIGAYAGLLRAELGTSVRSRTGPGAAGTSEAGTRAAPTGDLDAAVAGIEHQVDRMSQLVSSLGDARAAGAGLLHLERTDTKIAGLLHRIVGDMAAEIGDHPVGVRCPTELTAAVDPLRFHQMVTALVANAARFSPPGAAIDIRARATGHDAEISIVDRGPGIADELLPTLFRQFATTDRSRGSYGLGLYIARGIARAHGGDIRYRRAWTGGADMVVQLPLRPIHNVAAGPRPDGRTGAELARARWLPDIGVGADTQALRAVIAAQRALAAAATGETVVGTMIDLVDRLGGWIVTTLAGQRPEETVLLDLSLGIGPPLWAAADGVSVARLRIDAVLPSVLDDARRASARLSRRRPPPGLDPLTAFAVGAAADKAIASATPTDAVILGRLRADEDDVRRMSRQLRSFGGEGRCARIDGQGPPSDVRQTVELAAVVPCDRLAALWQQVGVVLRSPPAVVALPGGGSGQLAWCPVARRATAVAAGATAPAAATRRGPVALPGPSALTETATDDRASASTGSAALAECRAQLAGRAHPPGMAAPGSRIPGAGR